MSPENSHLPPLAKEHRSRLFFLMVIIFALAVPAMVFYAVGYRYDFFDDGYSIRAVGGLYISSQVSDGTIFVDGESVNDMRIFRSAAYIQNLEEGVHEVYVERSGLRTWVKELPVFAHLVTEAQSFNMPIRPQIRLLGEWTDDAGVDIFFSSPTTTDLAFASTTNLIGVVASSTATSSLNRNLEYDYIASRFASSSAEAAVLEQYERYKALPFGFATDAQFIATTTATTTREYQDMKLYESGGEVTVSWEGDAEDIPYYFCVTNKGANLTAQLYGAHVYRQLTAQMPTSTNLLKTATFDQRYCRESIRIDRLGQNVKWFDFMPDNEHLVLMLLDDGLYVVEVDDRSWQNTQLLYPGSDIEVLLDGGRIFVHDGDYYVEVFTEINQ